jgi:hypothetical protein
MSSRAVLFAACLKVIAGSLLIVFGWWFKAYKLSELLPTREPMNTFLTIVPYIFWAIGCIGIVYGVAGYAIAKHRHRISWKA